MRLAGWIAGVLLLAGSTRAGVSPTSGERVPDFVPPAPCAPSRPGLAPPAGTLFATDGAALYTLDTTTGAATLVGGHGAISGTMASLVFSSAGTLYGFTIGGGQILYTIDTTTGAAAAVGPLGLGFVFEGGLAFTPDGTLYGANEGDAGAGFAFRVDPATGGATDFGSAQARDLDGLAAIGFTVHAIDRVSNSLGTLDLTTGLFTPTHVFGATVGNFGGLTYDPSANRFFAYFQGSPGLYSVDAVTGQETLIGGSLVAFDLALSPPAPLAVDFGALSAERVGGEVVIRFGTLREDDTSGFVVFRALDPDMRESLVQLDAWVEARGAGSAYAVTDPSPDPTRASCYVVQGITGSGSGSRSPVLAVAPASAPRAGSAGARRRGRAGSATP